MFRLIAIDFSQKSTHFSLLSPTSPCELSKREVTSPSNLKVVGALDNYSLVFVIFYNFFRQKIWKLVRTDRQTGRFLYNNPPPQTTFAGGIIKITISRIFRSIEFYPCYASLDLEILRQFTMHFVISLPHA
jgi:hypothetical protein